MLNSYTWLWLSCWTIHALIPHWLIRTLLQPGRRTWSWWAAILCEGISFFFFFWPRHAGCGILVPRPGVKLVPSALGAWSLNHWTAREVPLWGHFWWEVAVHQLSLQLSLETEINLQRTLIIVYPGPGHVLRALQALSHSILRTIWRFFYYLWRIRGYVSCLRSESC